MVMMFRDGWEKQTERWDMSLTSLPAMRETRYFYPTFLASTAYLEDLPR